MSPHQDNRPRILVVPPTPSHADPLLGHRSKKTTTSAKKEPKSPINLSLKSEIASELRSCPRPAIDKMDRFWDMVALTVADVRRLTQENARLVEEYECAVQAYQQLARDMENVVQENQQLQQENEHLRTAKVIMGQHKEELRSAVDIMEQELAQFRNKHPKFIPASSPDVNQTVVEGGTDCSDERSQKFMPRAPHTPPLPASPFSRRYDLRSTPTRVQSHSKGTQQIRL